MGNVNAYRDFFIFLTVLLSFRNMLSNEAEETCTDSDRIVFNAARRLTNGIIQSVEVVSLFGCIKACMHYSNCTVISYDRSGLFCELGNDVAYLRDTNISSFLAVTMSDLNYQPTWKEPCSNRPCADISDGVCIPLSSGNYTCINPLFGTECGNGWVKFNDSCYLFSEETESWPDAKISCANRRSHLAIVDSAAENSFVKSYASNLKQPKLSYWLDGIEAGGEIDAWHWSSTGDPLNFTDWFVGQPNLGTLENCLLIWRDLLFQWADELCILKYNYICEMRLAL